MWVKRKTCGCYSAKSANPEPVRSSLLICSRRTNHWLNIYGQAGAFRTNPHYWTSILYKNLDFIHLILNNAPVLRAHYRTRILTRTKAALSAYAMFPAITVSLSLMLKHKSKQYRRLAFTLNYYFKDCVWMLNNVKQHQTNSRVYLNKRGCNTPENFYGRRPTWCSWSLAVGCQNSPAVLLSGSPKRIRLVITVAPKCNKIAKFQQIDYNYNIIGK